MYDLIVLGGGPAGYLAGERASEGGLKVAVIEKRNYGGVCLNEGCIPSKALLYTAKIYDGAKHGEKYGVTAEGLKLDHAFAIKRKQKVVDTLVGGIKAKLKKLGADMIEGEGVIKNKDGEGFVVEVGGQALKSKMLLIATGSSPVIPPIPGVKEGLESGLVVTNREILELEKVPENLAVIGGGVIGLEMASYYNTAGSKVTVVEMLDHIAGNTDAEIGKILQKNYEKKGVEFKLGAKVVAVEKDGLVYEKDGKSEKVKADKILLSIGRRPSTKDIGLENIGVYLERGAIVTDEYMRTNVPGCYAAGDVNGKSMLAHTAYRETEVAINNMLGKRDKMEYNSVPAVIYTNPEVACVGLKAEEASSLGMDAVTVKLSMKYSGRYLAENEGGDGIMKLVADRKSSTVVGVHIIGNYSSEFIIAASMMVKAKMRIEDVKKFIFPHPTVCEILREGIFEIK